MWIHRHRLDYLVCHPLGSVERTGHVPKVSEGLLFSEGVEGFLGGDGSSLTIVVRLLSDPVLLATIQISAIDRDSLSPVG